MLAVIDGPKWAMAHSVRICTFFVNVSKWLKFGRIIAEREQAENLGIFDFQKDRLIHMDMVNGPASTKRLSMSVLELVSLFTLAFLYTAVHSV